MNKKKPSDDKKIKETQQVRTSFFLDHLSRFTKIFFSFFRGGKVSEIHYLEAKERYHTLKSTIDYYEDLQDPKESEKLDEESKKKNKDRMVAIKRCKESLYQAKDLITRKQDDLNNLWRALTRIRLIIFDKLSDSAMMSHQLDFCREEAYRLSVGHDPEVNDMLQKLAEATDDKGINVKQVKRITGALIERLNTIRTQRIYDQYIKIRTYRAAFWSLMVLAIVLIVNANLLVTWPDEVCFPSYEPFMELNENSEGPIDFFRSIPSLIVYHIKFLNNLLKINVIAFVFFSGLVGGFFSVVMRVRDRVRVPGEDAYFRYYVLTKPFIGALGAVIVYVLFEGQFVQISLVSEFTGEIGPEVFGFAFLSGFSERIVFPDFH